MSTGTAHVPDTEPVERSDRRTTWRIVLAVVAILAVAFALLLSYAVTEENGSDLASVEAWVLITLVSLVPGFLVGAAVWLAWWPSSEKAPWLLLVALASVALVMAGVAGAAVLGGRAYDDHQRVIAGGCSAHDTSVLSTFGRYGGEFTEPQGTVDGACQAWLILSGEDGTQRMAYLTSALAGDGWVTTDTAATSRTFTRDADVIEATVTRSDEGTTAISITAVHPR